MYCICVLIYYTIGRCAYKNCFFLSLYSAKEFIRSLLKKILSTIKKKNYNCEQNHFHYYKAKKLSIIIIIEKIPLRYWH